MMDMVRGYEIMALSPKGEEKLLEIYRKRPNGRERKAMLMFKVNDNPLVLRFVFDNKFWVGPMRVMRSKDKAVWLAESVLSEVGLSKDEDVRIDLYE